MMPQYIPFWPHPIYEYTSPLHESPRCCQNFQPSEPFSYYDPIPNRHHTRAAHYSQFVNPYLVPGRNGNPRVNVIRVPATYACQLRHTTYNGTTEGCPILHSRILDADICLYVYNMRVHTLHLTYNWLISLMERYPGYKDLHMIRSRRGIAALVGFDSNYNTRTALLALNGFVTTSQGMLRAKCVHRSIYLHIYERGFNPERFIVD